MFKKEGLFYSGKEGILFGIAGYTDGSHKVSDIISMLDSNAEELAKLVDADKKEVKTIFVSRSRRYKNMRVFYIETTVCPKEAFVITGNGWTMWKWLED